MSLNSNYTILALYATLFTWLLTTLGSSMVFFFKKISKFLMNASLSISAGIMLAASFFSLLNPALESAKMLNLMPWLIVSTGFFLGSTFMYITDKLIRVKKRTSLLILSITIHNIPEGLAIGIAFGSGTSLTNAIMFALAIALQNFPEGSAVSLPLRREKYSRCRSFLYGSLSAIVEPIFGVIGALLTIKLSKLMPLFLSFAAGAMVYVIVKELIPESQSNNNNSLITMFFIIGFLVMMLLDTLM